MVPTLKFLEALSMLPSVARIRRRAKRAWGGSVPIQLDFALVGAQIADHILLFSDDQRAYIRGVIEYALKEGPHYLRVLVLRLSPSSWNCPFLPAAGSMPVAYVARR